MPRTPEENTRHRIHPSGWCLLALPTRCAFYSGDPPEYILQSSLSLSGQKEVTSGHRDSHSSGACRDFECVYLGVCWVCCYQGSKCCLCPIVGLLRQRSLGVTLQESGGVVLSRHRALQAFKTNPSAP